MAEATHSTLDSLHAQVNELSNMLDQVESGLQDIHRAWDGIARREFRRYGISFADRRRQNASQRQTSTSDSMPSTGENTGSNPFVGSGGSDLISNLGAMFGKSPEEMTELLQKAQQILAGTGNLAAGNNTDLLASMQQILGGGNAAVPGNTVGTNEMPGGVSASVAKVAAHLPAKLQAIASSVYQAANEDPFVRTAVELDSRLRNMSETIESVIGIFLLLRDISSRTGIA